MELKTYSNSQIITARQLRNLAHVTETRPHDNGVVPVFLVVVVNGLDTLDTGVVLLGVFLLRVGLVPVEDTTNEWRDEKSAGFSAGNGLNLREEECEIAVDAVLRLEDVRSFYAFVG